MKNFLKKIVYKLARRKFVSGFDKFCKEKKGRALLYFKTEEFVLHGFLSDFSHVNSRESYEISKVLNSFGFVVDIIDRTATLPDIQKYVRDEYDFFIGLGVGDSGRYFADIGEITQKAIRVLYAMGPEPDLSNKITKARHNYFRLRHPNIPIMDRRIITAVDTKRLYSSIDAIITVGNDFSYGSYLGFGKPVEKIFLTTYPGLHFDESEASRKSPKKFLYFGGNGNIVKGLDLVIEVFAKQPDLELYIGAAPNEEDFNAFARPIINQSKNIHWLGFVDVSGKLFEKVTRECGYVILPSASEGCATSVTTCMRRGLVPVVTAEAGVELGDFGYLIPEGNLESVEKTVNLAASSSTEELKKRSIATYRDSIKYTDDNFQKTFRTAIERILKMHNFLV